MGVFSSPIGMGVTLNPLIDSPFIQQSNVGVAYPPMGAEELLTEGGTEILTESGKNITTE